MESAPPEKLKSLRNILVGTVAALFLVATLPIATVLLSAVGIIGAILFSKDAGSTPTTKDVDQGTSAAGPEATSREISAEAITASKVDEASPAAVITAPKVDEALPGAAVTAAKVDDAPPAAAATAAAAATPAMPEAGAGICKPAATGELPVEPTQPSTKVPANTAAPSTGGGAILARLRQQRAAKQALESAKAGDTRGVTVVYGSQTGTCQEIARNIHAAAQEKGFKAQLASFNELGFTNLTPSKTPVLVLVASSTGDGDPPDNAAQVWVQLRKKQPEGMLSGMQYTVLGLGDSNYTRFMQVPRGFRTRFADLGADCFYQCAEADEVDGIEEKVEGWMEGLWGPLREAVEGRAVPVPPVPGAVLPAAAAAAAVQRPASAASSGSAADADAGAAAAGGAAAAAPAALVGGLAPEGVDLKGVPALPAPRIKLVFEPDASRVRAVAEAEAAAPAEVELAYRDPDGQYSAAQPFWAEVTGARCMTASWSDRRVLHVELGVGGSGMQYGAGDSIGVLPRNSEEMVTALLRRLNLGGSKVFSVASADGTPTPGLAQHLGWPCTLRSALTLGADITAPPRKSLIRLLAEHCSDDAEKRTLLFLTSRAGRAAYNTEVVEKSATLLDLLNRFRSCQPPVDELMDALPPLAPRMYSLTCAPEACPDQVQVALSVVSFETEYGTRQGVASTWLDRVCQPLLVSEPGAPGAPKPEPIRIPIFLRKGGDFHPPDSLDKPVVMVGPGTGVAPFRGFLQSRQAAMQASTGPVAPAWLFFGCRRADEDYLYREDLESFAADGTLTQLLVAFSRAGPEKVYVQHLMRQKGGELAELLLGGAYVYVCGDGAGMARDVHAVLVEVLAEHGGMTAGEAAARLQGWAKEGRYVRDIWS